MTNKADYKLNKQCNKPSDIDTKLQAIKDQLEQAKKDVTEKTNIRDTLQIDVTDLTKIHDQADDIYKKYQEEYQNDKAIKDDIGAYIPGECNKITGSLSQPVMDKIDEYITEARDDIQGKEEYVNGLQEIYKKAQEDYEKDKQTFTEAQNCFESYKKRPQEIKDDLKKLTDMRDTIKANDDAQKEGYLLKNYFWITQLIDGNEELKIETPTEFKNKYTCYWCEMEEAQEKSRASEKEMTKAKEKYEQENEILTKMNDNFASDILDKITKIPISDCLKTQTCQTSKD